MSKSKTSPNLLVLAALASHAAIAGGKIRIGVAIVPDY